MSSGLAVWLTTYRSPLGAFLDWSISVSPFLLQISEKSNSYLAVQNTGLTLLLLYVEGDGGKTSASLGTKMHQISRLLLTLCHLHVNY